jgi:hypothetical protein
MPYNFLSEDDNKFTLGNGDEQFSIAKYGLDDDFMEKLRMLPRNYDVGGQVQGYAAGGMVEMPPEPGMQDEDAVAQAAMSSAGLAGDIGAGVGGFMGDVLSAGATAPYGMTAQVPVTGPSTAQPTAEPAKPVSGTSQMPDSVGMPSMPDYYKMMQDMTAQAPGQVPQVPSDMAAAFKQMQDASLMQAEAKSQAALDQQLAMDESMKDLQLEQLRYDTKVRALDQKKEALVKDIQTGKIDPTRAYSNMSTGNRVMAGISILLGGLSQGLTGAKSNPAMDVINNAVDRDIDAQKAELGKKQNLLSVNLHEYGTLKDALAATKMQIMTVAQTQVNMAAAKAGSKQALAAAQMFNADIDLKMAAIKQQLAASQAMSEKLNQPGGLSYKDVSKLNQELQDKMVQLPNGNYMPAFNKESASKVKDIQSEIYRVKDTLSQARKFMEQGSSLPLTDRNRLAKTINQRVLGELKSKAMLDLGALTEADLQLLEPLVPSVGDFFSTSSKQKLDQLNQMLDSKMNAHYSAYVPGLNPSGRASREKSVFGRP